MVCRHLSDVSQIIAACYARRVPGPPVDIMMVDILSQIMLVATTLVYDGTCACLGDKELRIARKDKVCGKTINFDGVDLEADWM